MRLIALAAALCAASSGIAAPKADDSRVPSWKQNYLAEGRFDTRVLRAIGFCAVDGRRAEVERYLATHPWSQEEGQAFAAVFEQPLPSCLAGDWSFRINSGPVMRGVLAENLYKKLGRQPKAPALPAPAPFPQWAAANLGPEALATPRLRDLVVGTWVARCATARSPREAHQVIKYESSAPGETRALEKLRPAFLACLPEGESLRVTRRTIRYMIAEGLYEASLTHKEQFANA